MKEIKGFTGYFVTEDGKVFSTKQGYLRELIPFKGTSRGKKTYLMVGIIDDNGIRYKKLIHRLVAEAYIPNPHNLPEVNHKDRNIYNNDKSNLEWVTRKENMEHMYSGEDSPVRNTVYCELYKDNELVSDFNCVLDACRYANQQWGASIQSLQRYKKNTKLGIEIKVK